MWVVYRKKDLTIIGLTVLSEFDPDKQTAIEEIVKGTRNPGHNSEYNAIQVADMKKASPYFQAFPRRLVVIGTDIEPKLVIRDSEFFSIHIETDAPDKHPVDGIPEIPADGVSSVLITLRKMDERSRPQTGKNDNDKLYLRTNHGEIRDSKGKVAISDIKLEKGEAKIRLVSEKLKRVATIEILSEKPELRGCTLRIEFI